jgi:hypothetical protein
MGWSASAGRLDLDAILPILLLYRLDRNYMPTLFPYGS